VSATAITDALAELEKLNDEYRKAQSATDLHSANAGRAEARLRRLKLDRVAAYKEAARGRDSGVEAIEEELVEVEAQLEREQAAAEGALQARREVEQEIPRLHRRYLPAFIEEAETYTKQAREALAELAQPYRAAEATWDAARSKWGPLAEAITAEMKQLREADGVYSAGAGDSEASRVPPFPLAASGSVFERSEAGVLSARPPAVQPDD